MICTVFVLAAELAHLRGGGGGGRGGGGGGGGGASGASASAAPAGGDGQAEWACTACTFLNNRRLSHCAMCGTRLPPEERPPDGTYRDRLISYVNPIYFGDDDDFRSHYLSQQRSRRRRPAGSAESMAAAAEAARCELSERAAGGVRNRGGASGGASGGAGRNNDGNSGSAISDAAAGSALGALGAGVLSAMAPGSRPGRVIASMVQGALVGGVAGAALGNGFRFDSTGEGGGGGGGGGGGNTAHGDGGRNIAPGNREDPNGFGEFAGQRRQLLVGLGSPERQVGVARDLEWLLMTQHLRGMGLSRADAAGIVEGVAAGGMGFGEGDGDGGGGARPASAAAIAALPQETLGAGSLSRMAGDDDDGGVRQCCICLDAFGAEEVVTRLPCLHLYHSACIKQWLHTSGTCPQCKHRVD